MDNKHFVDIPFTKETNVDEYIGAFNIQDDTIDFDKLDEYNNSKYVLNADGLQGIESVVDNMQLNWEHDITNNLDDKTQLFQSWINNLATVAKEWEPGASNKYYKNDVVTYNEDPGAYFICLEDCDGTEPINYVKFTNSSNRKDSFNWGLCVNNDIDDSNESFIGTSESGSINAFQLTYKYDGEYKLEFTKKDTFVGEINYLIFNGDREIFQHMNFIVNDSKWLRVYIRGDAGQNSFDLDWRGEWESGESYIHGAAIPPKFIPPSLVWYQVGSVINFYVCIQNVTSDIPPHQDSEHWVKLFSKQLDAFVILDEMQDQEYFDDNTNPSVFGVTDYLTYNRNTTGIKYRDYTFTELDEHGRVPNVQKLNDGIIKVVVEVYKNGELNDTMSNAFFANNKSNEFRMSTTDYDFDVTTTYYDVEGDCYIWFDNNITIKTESYSLKIFIDTVMSIDMVKIIDRIHTTYYFDPFYLLLRGSGGSLRDDNGVSFNTILRNLILRINI